jgi:hypothetical protein
MAVAVAAGAASAAPLAKPVTLSLRQYTNESKVRVVVWYGQIASGAAGENVEVLGRDCGTKGFRQYTATQTVAGGGWEVESIGKEFPPRYIDVNSGTTFRARWRGQLSNTIDYRLPLPWFLTIKIPGKRAWKVTVNPAPLYMTMKGRAVVLQRQSGGKWVQYKRAKLVHKPNYDYGGATNYEAIFEIPARGLRVRALLPAKTVAPCYLAKATAPWRS